jgi:hypothetical protein
MNTYALVNPMIVGTMKTTVNAPNSSTAAVELYNRISPYFSTVQSNFLFTIQKIKNDKQVGGGTSNSYHSYQVTNQKNNTNINGTINGISINNKQPSNTIVKICVSDRKISNQSLIDSNVRNKVTSKIMYQAISPDR